MSKKNVYQRFGWLIVLAAGLSLPLVFHGAMRALEGNANNPEDWLPPGNREVQGHRGFTSKFGTDEILVASWNGCTLEDDRLERLAEGMRAATSPDHEGQPQLLFREHHVSTGAGALSLLVSPPISLPRSQAIERLRGWLVGPDGATTCVVAVVSDFGVHHRREAVESVYAIAEKECGLPRNDLYLGGPTTDAVAIDDASSRSLFHLTSLCLVMSVVITWLCLRDFRLVLYVYATALYSLTFSLALVHFCGDRMDSILITMPTLVYVTTISGGIHVVNYYLETSQARGLANATVRAVQIAFVPGSLAAVTTALGVGSLFFSQMLPIRRFGLYGSIGVMIGLVLTFTLLPAALELVPPRRRTKARHGAQHQATGIWTTWPRALGGLILRYHRAVGVVAVLLIAFPGFGVLWTRTSVKLQDLFSPETRIIRDYAWLEEHIGPLVPIEVVVHFGADSKMSLVERFELVARLQNQIATDKDVGGTISAATFAPPIPQDKSIRGLTRRNVLNRLLPKQREKFQEAGLLHADAAGEVWRITARVKAMNNLDYGVFLHDLRERVDPFVKEHAGVYGVTAEYTGAMPIIYIAQRQLLADLINSFLSAFAMMAACMVILLRSVVAGLLAMIPNVLPAAIVFGVIGVAGWPVDIGSMMTASIAMGIAVDGTLHFVTFYRRLVQEGASSRAAILETYDRCAGAMASSTLICTLGLVFFCLSEFTPISRFAWLMGATLYLALAADLMLTPSLLAGPFGRFFVRRAQEQPAAVDAVGV
jgi:predicted RND superfamily exporter protein